MKSRIQLGAAFLALFGCGANRPVQTAPLPRGVPPIVAPAPEDLTEEDLGMPVDKNFVRIPGAKSLRSGKIRTYSPNSVSANCFTVTKQEQLHASRAGYMGLGVGPFGGGVAAEGSDIKSWLNKVAFCEHFHKVRVAQLDGFNPVGTPADARYVISKIEFGHSLEMLVHAAENSNQDSSSFSANASFASFFEAGGKLTAGSSTSTGTATFAPRLRGMSARSSASGPTGVLANSPDDFKLAYQEAVAPVPVVVEYSRIPTVDVEEVPAASEPEPRTVRIVHLRLDSFKDGQDGAPPWKVQAICRVSGREVSRTDVTAPEGINLDSSCREGSIDMVDGKPHVGPGGDPNYCKSNLETHVEFRAKPGDPVECVYRGTVANWTLPESLLTFSVGNTAFETRVGNFDEQAEYWLWVRVEQ